MFHGLVATVSVLNRAITEATVLPNKGRAAYIYIGMSHSLPPLSRTPQTTNAYMSSNAFSRSCERTAWKCCEIVNATRFPPRPNQRPATGGFEATRLRVYNFVQLRFAVILVIPVIVGAWIAVILVIPNLL